MPDHLLEIDDLRPAELLDILAKADDPSPPQLLAGKGVGLIFEKASGRTRNATEMAVVAPRRSPREHARRRGRHRHTRDRRRRRARAWRATTPIVGARVKSHAVLERMAAVSPVPVINLLQRPVAPVPGHRRPPHAPSPLRRARGLARRLRGRLQQRGAFTRIGGGLHRHRLRGRGARRVRALRSSTWTASPPTTAS